MERYSLDGANVGFGPFAPVSAEKFDVLLSASASVAALVFCEAHETA